MFDLVLAGGMLIDGTGVPARRADVAVKDGRIAAVGQLSAPAAQRLDATGLFVSPGFLDIHRHGDAAVFRPDYGRAELFQGLTTVVNGACGVSALPFGPERRAELAAYLEPITGELPPQLPTGSLGEYFRALSGQKLPLNVAMMVGHGTIRAGLQGYGEEGPADLGPTHRALEQALADGACGVSLGLGYAPECFTTTQELIDALAPLRGGSVPITVHMRQEGDGVCDSVQEMITLARALRCPVHISHLKAMGKRNWQKKIPRALALMAQAREEGLELSCDAYPYDAGSTQLIHLLPPEYLKGGVDAICAHLTGGAQHEILRRDIETRRDFDNIAQMVGWENILLSALHRHTEYLGLTVAQSAQKAGMEPVDFLCSLLVDEHCAVTMIDRMACEEDICTILRDPFASVISDATYPTTGMPHPRVYGSCIRLFERFVVQKSVLTLEEAVRRVTSLPAETMGLRGKGVVQVGADADLNLFRLEALHERATYLDPRQVAQGPETVLVNGRPAILHGQWTGEANGKVLRR